MKIISYVNSLFEQPWWLDIVAPGKWNEIIIKDKSENTVGRFAYLDCGNRIEMPPLTQTLGVWIAPEFKNNYGEQKRIITDIFSKLKNYHSVQHSLSPDNTYILPLRWLGYSIEPRFTYRISDLTDIEKVYANFTKTAKKNIKSAKNKVTLQYDTNADTLWSMLNKTFQNQNRKNPMSKELVYSIIKKCDESGHGQYIEAVDTDGNTHSCAYFVYDEQICYYLFGASDPKFRNSGAQSFILWDGIQFAAKHSKVFDFEGSMIEGIENFFRQFGGECTVYYGIKKVPFIKEIGLTIKPYIKRLLGYKM